MRLLHRADSGDARGHHQPPGAVLDRLPGRPVRDLQRQHAGRAVRPVVPGARPLRTRDSTDFSIALLDAWAVALDILTFYQERFANEAFLRTAVDQRSVFELARARRLRALTRRGRLGGARLHPVQRARIARTTC